MRNVDGSTFLGVRATCASFLVVLLVAVGLLGPWAAAPRAQAQPGLYGEWETLPYTMPINPIHMALMRNGKVLVVAGSGNDQNENNWRAAVLDLALGQFVVTGGMSWDMFCNGMVTLPDGRVLINGGNLKYDPFWGEPRNAVFDPETGAFTDIENMAHGRWYPTPTVLGDGRVMTFSGLLETGGTNTTVEIYTPGAGWSPEYPAGWTPPLYPRMHLLPNGNVFYAGPGRGSRIFNTITNTWSAVIANTILTSGRHYGTSVLLPLSPPDYRARVMIAGGGSPTATTEIIEPLAATPAWASGPPMSQARIQLNATILPSGRILVTGGSSVDESAAAASLNADLYDPASNTFSSAGANAFARLYHSNALLLPDARVLLAGGNPERGNYEARMEVYSPAYLFTANNTPAQRPTITSVPAGAINYGTSFQVQTPDASSIASVVLIRPGTPTHAFDQDQRMVRLAFKSNAGTLGVVAPPNGNIAPPGYYMLFVLNSAGVPSVARFVRLASTSGGPPPPTTVDDAHSTPLNTPLNVAAPGVLANDDSNGGGAMTAVLVSNVSSGVLTLAENGGFAYTPNAGFAGTATFTYRAVTSFGNGNVATVTITVEPAPPPTTVNDAYSTPLNTLLNVAAPGVLANDTSNGGGAMTAVLVSNVSSGVLTLAANGGFAYTPNAGFAGTATFTYRAVTSFGNGNVATVTVTVEPAPPPTTVNDAYSTPFNTPLHIAAPGVLANDNANGGGAMTAVPVSTVSNGVLALAGNGGVAYTPNAGFIGTDTFTYRAVTTSAQGNVGTVTIAVGQPTTVQPPTGLRVVSVVGNSVTLRWDSAPTGPLATDHLVEGGINPGEVLAGLNTGSAYPMFTFPAPNGAFYIRAHALRSGDKSAASNEIRLFVNVPQLPSAPTNLLGVVNGSSLGLAWINTFAGGAPTTIALDVAGAGSILLPGETDRFEFPDVPAGTYTLSVRAINAAGSSGPSSPVTLTFPGPCSGAPLAPANFLAYQIGTTAYVMWDPPASGPSPTGYMVNVTGSFVGDFPTTARFLSPTVAPGIYTVRVTAVNACGTATTGEQTITVP
jgi:Domain of unknown function (DUF1929)/Bacterial Ig domain